MSFRIISHTSFILIGLGRYQILLNIQIFSITCDIFHDMKKTKHEYQTAVTASLGFYFEKKLMRLYVVFAASR